MDWLEFSKYENSDSKFNAELSTKGGYITFSNSGKGGNKKYFTLSLESFLVCLKDILANHSSFLGHEKYIEKEWRDLGSRYYSDNVANAQCTVQTKPMFATLSKIIIWANTPNLDSIDPEETISLDKDALQNAVTKLTSLAAEFTPETKNNPLDTFPSGEGNEIIEQFSDWLISKDGATHNYFRDSFSSNKSKLIEALKKYETEYENDFNEKVFSFMSNDINQFISHLESNLYSDNGSFYDFSSKVSNHMPRAILGKNNYIQFLKEKSKLKATIQQNPFNILGFENCCSEAGLHYSSLLIKRFISSILTKPFVILTGLSGSGKTKLAQAFVQWICQQENQYRIIPVGADWTNREPLLGYPNGLDPKSYVTPDSGALQLILEASKKDNENKPFFMILDEMNLSHVERYFADFLSIMESGDSVKLYSGEKRYTKYERDQEPEEADFIPHEIQWPQNLFIIGTVNIDETTYMFSPKVLDRANVIEFRISPIEMKNFFVERKDLTMKKLFLKEEKSNGGVGQAMGESFFNIAKDKAIIKIPEINGESNILNKFFSELQIVGSEFGYRSATEIELLITKLGINELVDSDKKSIQNNDKIDIAIMQKLLPKLHGSRSKLVKILIVLSGLCVEGITIEDFEKNFKDFYKKDFEDITIKYPISFEKLIRMYKNVLANGFTSYAEA